MKKKNKKNHIKMRFSTLLLCCLAIVLCAAPCGWADGSYKLYDGEICYLDGVEICDVTEDLVWLVVGAGTTVNLYASVEQYVIVGRHSVLNIYSGGSVEKSVHVGPDSVLNIYSGNVGDFIDISPISPDDPDAQVTVYGKNFNVSNGAIDSEGKWLPADGSGILTVTYSGNGDPIELKFFSDDIPIKLKETDSKVVEIDIDIKPGGNPNNINLRSKGVVPVAVFTTDDFDASTIDPGTVLFAGASPVRWKLCDVDDDGDKDMLFHFKTQDLKLAENDTEATLTGETFDEVEIAGTDTVRIVQSKK